MTAVSSGAPPVPARDPAERPLVVDLDGTILNSDMLAEAFFALLGKRPFAALAMLFEVLRGRAALKARLARAVELDLSLLPWNEPFLERLRAERARGRRIFLASASTRMQVEAVARHLGLFDGVFASNGKVNLRSRAKAAALVRAFGEGGFDYAGDSRADLAVWRHAGGVIAVNARAGLLRRVMRRWPEALIVAAPSPAAAEGLRAAGVGLWPAVLLAFLPAVVAGQSGDLRRTVDAVLALLCSIAGASMLAGLVGLERDRRDPARRTRPFAAGTIPPPRAIRPMLSTFAVTLAAALQLGWPALGLVVAEAGLTLAAWSAGQPTAGWAMRALWFAVPIVGGCVATGAVPTLPWLAAAAILCAGLALVLGPGQAGAIFRRRNSE